MDRRINSHRPRTDVTVNYSGRVVCPEHGELSAVAEYEPGRAECGCMFVAVGRTGILRREVARGNGESQVTGQIVVSETPHPSMREVGKVRIFV